jgi:ADP-heptose:LPS heptosyltransferase
MSKLLFDMTIPKIGDFILLTPALRAAQKWYPDSRVVVPPPLKNLYGREGILNNVCNPEVPQFPDERVVDLSFPLLHFRPRPGADVLDRSLFAATEHVSVIYYRALRKILTDLPEEFSADPFLAIDADVDRLRRFRLKPFSYCTIHSGSDFAPKNWGDEKFEDLIRAIAAEWPDLQVVGLFGPRDEELFRGKKAPSQYRGLRTSLENVADVLAGGLFHVDNDSGINHLAGALNTPSISVWGFTGPGTWGAIGEPHYTFWGGPSCADHCGGARAESCEHRSCLKSIQPADLMEAVREILMNYDLEALAEADVQDIEIGGVAADRTGVSRHAVVEIKG